jgi:hypothetical protein
MTNLIGTKLPLAGGTLSGNLGIGITTPLHLLDVKGGDGSSLRLGFSNYGGGHLRIDGVDKSPSGTTSSFNHTIRFKTKTAGSNAGNGGEVDAILLYHEGWSGTHVVSFPSSKVGIGTTSPTQKLEVAGTVKATSFQGDGSNLTGVAAAIKSATAPSSPSEGTMWFNTSASSSSSSGIGGKTMAVYNGTDWSKMSSFAVGTLENPADNAEDILADNPNATNGGYYIKSGTSTIYVYCNMSDYGGGWMGLSRNTSYNQWNSSSNSEYSSSNTSNFYSILREAKSFNEVYIKWNGGGAWYSGYSGSQGLKAISNVTLVRQGGDDLIHSTYSLLGSHNDALLYIKLPCPAHRGVVFSNYYNNASNQGGFMEWCGPHANTSVAVMSPSETYTYYEVYIR